MSNNGNVNIASATSVGNINSLAALLASQSREERVRFLSSLTLEELSHLKYDWDVWARPNQRWDSLWADPEKPFSLVLAGRGFGKTRCAVEAVRTAVYEHGYKYISLTGATATDARQIMVEGEALALDTSIPTPSGWKTMGELSVGDYIFGDDGKPVKILWESAVATNRPCYKVLFSDGNTIIADENHKWWTYSHSARQYMDASKHPNNKCFPKVVTTLEIKNSLTRYKTPQANHAIPLTEPLCYGEKELPIHPYILGCWLGDGRVRGGDYTTNDIEIIELMQKFGYKVTKHAEKYAYRICGIDPLLKLLNLINNKHVPEIYLQGSIEQRLWLLKGLMDTDGYISERGACTFDNNNINLIINVRELVRSLGMSASNTLNPKYYCKYTEAKPMYKVIFTPYFEVFSLERKNKRIRKERSKKVSWKTIKDVIPCESVPVKCIAVDNESHLFLAGESMVITHNSGILNCFPDHQRPEYHSGVNELKFPNGAKGFIYSADSPERLRGKQCDFFWADELCAWERMRDSFDQIMFGCRLGAPRGIVTTTPKPSELLNELLCDPLFNIITGSTYDNQANLAPSFLQQIVKKYEGTRLGEQELHGIVLGEIMGALWNAGMFRYTDLSDEELMDKCSSIVISLDPAVTSNSDSDSTGIMVCGVDREENYYVLEDVSGIYSPNQWREKTMEMYDKWEANMVTAETNQGGDLVKNNLPARLPYKGVHAKRAKVVRAEPVKSYYEQGKVFHRRGLTALEKQMCEWIPAKSKKSPDRIDAMVYGWTHLLGVESRSNGLIATRLYD